MYFVSCINVLMCILYCLLLYRDRYGGWLQDCRNIDKTVCNSHAVLNSKILTRSDFIDNSQFSITITIESISMKSDCLGNHLYLEYVRSLFDSTQSQESKYDIVSFNRMRQCALGPILRPILYLWCPWS